MTVRLVHVSDLSGEQIAEEALGKLILRAHPKFPQGMPVELEATQEEIDKASVVECVFAEWVPPDGGERQLLTILVDDFDRLAAEPGILDGVIADQIEAQRGSRRGGFGVDQVPDRPRKRSPALSGKRPAGYYWTLEHAGEPHVGRVHPNEARIVRKHLDEVNQRLRDKGMREIDPTQPSMRERYQLDADDDDQ
jgi:hypothetical protein